LNLAPMDAAGHFTMAWVLYSAQRVNEAEHSVQEALHHSPNFAMAYLLQAEIHRKQNKTQAVVEDLTNFLRLDPNGPRSAGAKEVLEKAERSLKQMPADGRVNDPA